MRVQISRILQLPDKGETTLGNTNEKPVLKEHEVLGTLLEVLFVLRLEILRAVIITGRGLGAQKYRRTVTGSRDPIECPRPLSDSDVALLLSMVLNLTSTLMRHETQILIKHANGFISLMPVGSRAILGIFVPMEVKLGLVALEGKKICQKIEEIIPPDYPDIVNRAEDIDVREQISRLLQLF